VRNNKEQAMTTATKSKKKTSTKGLERAKAEALRMMDIESFDARNRDALDFYVLHVETLRRVVERAFEAGMKAAK
jgi:hypothetical protein